MRDVSSNKLLISVFIAKSRSNKQNSIWLWAVSRLNITTNKPALRKRNVATPDSSSALCRMPLRECLMKLQLLYPGLDISITPHNTLDCFLFATGFFITSLFGVHLATDYERSYSSLHAGMLPSAQTFSGASSLPLSSKDECTFKISGDVQNIPRCVDTGFGGQIPWIFRGLI